MKALQFTIPVEANKTIITKKELLPFFYPHLHRHHEVQLVWIIKGQGTLVAGNAMHSFESNEIYWLSANQPHVFKSSSICFDEPNDGNVETLTIFFNTEGLLNSFFNIPELAQLKEFLVQNSFGFKVPMEIAAFVSSKMEAIHQQTGVAQFLLFIELLKQLAEVKNLQPLSREMQTIRFKEDEGIRMGTIYNHIMQHYTQPIKLEDVAKLAFMTPQAFCRYFKKHTRQTLVEFVNQVRINEACKKLVDSPNESISSVAYTSGFNSVTNFNRVFKLVTKRSPKEYIGSYLNHVKQNNGKMEAGK